MIIKYYVKMANRLKPNIQKTGTYVRIKVYKGKLTPSQFKYQEVGDKGHTQKISGYHSKKGWFTYGWVFKKLDIKNRREKTMKILRGIGIKEADLKSIDL